MKYDDIHITNQLYDRGKKEEVHDMFLAADLFFFPRTEQRVYQFENNLKKTD